MFKFKGEAATQASKAQAGKPVRAARSFGWVADLDILGALASLFGPLGTERALLPIPVRSRRRR